MKTHLLVIQCNGEQNTRLFNPRRTEFRWNDDCSAFQPIPLRWWDDASYIRYQCGEEG